MRSNIDDHWLGEVRFLSRSPKLIAEKNLTLLSKFGIILIESERVTIKGDGTVVSTG